MKRIIKIMAVLMSVAIAFATLMLPVKAEAAGARTFSVVYDIGNSRWAWSVDGGAWREMGSLADEFKDGDILGICGDTALSGSALYITVNARISELGVAYAPYVNVTAKGVDYVYSTTDSTVIVNSNVKKAECYYTSVLQINGNCDEFKAYYNEQNEQYPVFAVTGTVGKADVWSTETYHTGSYIYSIPAGKFISTDIGGVWLEAGEYSMTPPKTTNTKTPQYDKVPKTGYGIAGSALFLILSAVCATGGVVLKKKKDATV